MVAHSAQTAETVLVIGATGNIGVAAVIAALRSGRHVIAAVRNQQSAKKLTDNVDQAQDRLTIVEADVASSQGVQGIVDKVKAGELPAFQHVHASVGGSYTEQSLLETSVEDLHEYLKIGLDANFNAYRATIPYLLEQKETQSSFTICTGSQGDMGIRVLPAMVQGALFALCFNACSTLAETNIRFNEIYLGLRVEFDSEAEKHGVTKASTFAKVYEQILARPEIKSTRVRVTRLEDLDTLRTEQKPNYQP